MDIRVIICVWAVLKPLVNMGFMGFNPVSEKSPWHGLFFRG
jgi:hypothetical protein